MAESIVLGVAPGELLDPFHESLSRGYLRRLFQRMDFQNPYCFETAIEATGFIVEHAQSGAKLVEVYGIWEDLCVATSISRALENGFVARVPKGFTFRSPGAKRQTLEDDVRSIYEGKFAVARYKKYDSFYLI